MNLTTFHLSGTDEISRSFTIRTIGQLAVLGILLLWTLVTIIVDWLRRLRSIDSAVIHEKHATRDFLIACFLLLSYYGWVLWNWMAISSLAGPSASSSLFLAESLEFIPFAGSLIVAAGTYWASTDLIEIGLSVVGGINAVVQRFSWVLYVLGIGASLWLLIPAIQAHHMSTAAWATAAVFVVAIALVLAIARSPLTWPRQPPVLSLLLATAAMVLALELPLEILGQLGAAGTMSEDMAASIAQGLVPVLAVVPLLGGFAFAAWGRLRQNGTAATVGIFLVIFGGYFFITTANSNIHGFELVAIPAHVTRTIEIIVSVASLVAIAWLFFRQRTGENVAVPLGVLFATLIGFQVVSVLFDYANAQPNIGAVPFAMIAGFFLLTSLWDVMTSGERVTNNGSKAAPRAGRVMLYFGYTLFVSSVFLYVASLLLTKNATIFQSPELSSFDDDARVATALLGYPLVLVTGIMLLSTWFVRRQAAPAASSSPSAKLWPRALFTGICVLGLLVVVATGLYALPTVIQRVDAAAFAPYHTDLPGNNCDPHPNAGWTDPLPYFGKVTCLTSQNGSVGLEIITNPPPGGLRRQLAEESLNYLDQGFKPNYQVSVHIHFLTSDHTYCASLIAREQTSIEAKYLFAICPNGLWVIILTRATDTSVSYSILNAGTVAGSQDYDLSATCNGTFLSIGINGQGVGLAGDSTSRSGTPGLAVLNLSTSQAEGAIFSNFTYTPLH